MCASNTFATTNCGMRRKTAFLWLGPLLRNSMTPGRIACSAWSLTSWMKRHKRNFKQRLNSPPSKARRCTLFHQTAHATFLKLLKPIAPTTLGWTDNQRSLKNYTVWTSRSPRFAKERTTRTMKFPSNIWKLHSTVLKWISIHTCGTCFKTGKRRKLPTAERFSPSRCATRKFKWKRLRNHFHIRAFRKWLFQNTNRGEILWSGRFKKMFRENSHTPQVSSHSSAKVKTQRACSRVKADRKEPTVASTT